MVLITDFLSTCFLHVSLKWTISSCIAATYLNIAYKSNHEGLISPYVIQNLGMHYAEICWTFEKFVGFRGLIDSLKAEFVWTICY
ncbi:hypothetical protein L6452_06693 [Arctium lappa]|uniref:Uncharacterized protein n=1 Tax=Arctium lappa TaxID=4217 RepID=A0ACB9EKJ5_ARCLA|nr:hypothetical protein L6452_06693 [Arctium lappa]